MAFTEAEEATEETKRQMKKTEEKQEKHPEECSIKGCSAPDAFPRREENVRRSRRQANGGKTHSAHVSFDRTGRSSINAINSMRGICVNLNHKSNPSSLFPSVKSYRSSKRVIRSNQYKTKNQNTEPYNRHCQLPLVMEVTATWN